MNEITGYAKCPFCGSHVIVERVKEERIQKDSFDTKTEERMKITKNCEHDLDVETEKGGKQKNEVSFVYSVFGNSNIIWENPSD